MLVEHRLKSGRHLDKLLTALQVRNLTEPGRYPDGNGLFLVVAKSGGKRWMLRTVVNGRRRDMGLGGLSYVSLAEAREKAYELRKTAREGGDPLAERQRKKEASLTFAAAVERVHADHKGGWKNPKHAQQWINTVTQYAVPIIGDFPVDRIGTPEVMKVLSPIWLTKPETARRVRQRLGTIFDWAKASGYRTGDNPVDGVSRGLPKQSDKDVHHAALPYKDVGAFTQRLRTPHDDDMARLAFEFLILTAARTGEIIGARKPEIDLEEKVWSVPAERMKASRLHRVPLSERALAIAKRAIELAPEGEFLFPAKNQRSFSNMVFLKMLQRMAVQATAHGFRSSFRDWTAEATNFPREVAEMALAHTIANKVEAAYRRGDLLDARRELMEAWSRYIASNLKELN